MPKAKQLKMPEAKAGKVPPPPTGLTGSALSTTQIRLSWQSSPSAQGYYVLRDSSRIGGSTTTSFTDSHLTSGTTYHYQVQAYNKWGTSAPSSAISIATQAQPQPQPPATPTGLTGTGISETQIQLQWDAVTNADSYTVIRDGVVEGSTASTSYIDGGLVSGTMYNYQVEATNQAGTSGPSMVFSCEPLTGNVPPPGPGVLQALSVGGGGFVTGLSQAADGTLVARPDTFYGYARAPGASSWNNIVNAGSMPQGFVGFSAAGVFQAGVVFEVVVAPSNSQIMYMMYYGAIFKTINGGGLWTQQTDFSTLSPYPDGNTAYHQTQKRIGVDPTNPDHAIVTTGIGNEAGAWYTTDGGSSWHQISSITTTEPNYTVAFDPVTPTTVYVAAWSTGIYQSTTGVNGTFTLLTNTPFEVCDMVVNNGTLFACCNPTFTGAGNGDASTHLISYPGSGSTWTTNITWANGVHAIAVDPNDNTKMVVCDFGFALSTSSDSGSTWKAFTGAYTLQTNAPTASGNVLNFAAVPTWVVSGLFVRDDTVPTALPGAAFYRGGTAATQFNTFGQHSVPTVVSTTGTTVTLSANVTGTVGSSHNIVFCPTIADDVGWLALASQGVNFGGIAIDKTVSGRVIASGGTGVWYSDTLISSGWDSSATSAIWRSMTLGIEGLVANQIITLPLVSGSPIVSQWDQGCISCSSNPAATFPGPRGPGAQAFGGGWGLDYAKDNANVVMGIGYDFGNNSSGISTDGGVTWNGFTNDIRLGSDVNAAGMLAIAVSTSSNAVSWQQVACGISSSADNGSGAIRLTLGAQTTNFFTGMKANVSGTGTSADGNWIITVHSSTQVDLQGSTFGGAAASGLFMVSLMVYTNNLGVGATWNVCSSTPPAPQVEAGKWVPLLCCDGATANKYYFYNPGAGISVSMDGGNNWGAALSMTGAVTSPTVIDQANHLGHLRSVPGVANKLYFTEGIEAGQSYPIGRKLKVSTDGGTTWANVANVTDVADIGFGQPYPGQPSTNPTLWIYGCYSVAPITTLAQFLAAFGIWRSVDGGATWSRIQTNGQQQPFNNICSEVTSVAGDLNDYKKVYWGYFGGGFGYGYGFV